MARLVKRVVGRIGWHRRRVHIYCSMQTTQYVSTLPSHIVALPDEN